MKPGQLVMLIRTNSELPPTGAVGEVIANCSLLLTRVVQFQAYSNLMSCYGNGTYCVPVSWLMPIDDPDAIKAEEEKESRDISMDEAKVIGRKMLRDLRKDLEKEDA